MQYCTKCGAKILEKAEFCTQCGTPINSSDKTKNEPKDTKTIEDQIEETAENIGKKAEQIGKKIEQKADDAGKHMEQWYNKTFKIAGPLVGAFIGLIIMRLIIYIIQASNYDIHIVTAFSEGLYDYILIIFASMLLSGYNTYIYRKYKQQYQWIYPLISAIGFIIGAWVAAQIMLLINLKDNTPILAAIGKFIDTYLIGIFILALLIAYAAQIAFSSNYTKEKQ